MRRRALTAGFGILLCAAAALTGAFPAQSASTRKLPDELQQFWRDYTLAPR